MNHSCKIVKWYFYYFYFYPMKLKEQQWRMHLILVLIIIGMDIYGDYVYNGLEGVLKNLRYPFILNFIILYVTFFSIYTLNYLVICKQTLSKKKLWLFAFAIFSMVFIFAGLRYVLDEVVLFYFTGLHNYFDGSRSFVYYVFDNSYFAVKAILFSSSLYLLFEYLENRNRIHNLEIEQKKAELSFLKSQLEPHFLFNTLNSFYTELIDDQPKTAKDIYRLSELLRYVTYEAKQDFMPLQKEIQFIEDYLYFYKKRFEDALCLDYQIEGIISDQQIPSLVLIHFVENMFKHGITYKKESPATLSIQITQDHLILTTKNELSTTEKYSNKGIGKENLNRRLKAIYTNGYEFTYKKEGKYYFAYLRLSFKS